MKSVGPMKSFIASLAMAAAAIFANAAWAGAETVLHTFT